MEMQDKDQERFVHPHEAAEAAHHLKMAHHVKSDKFLHKAAKEHLQKESDALSGVLGKKTEKEMPKAKKEPAKAKKEESKMKKGKK